MNMIELKDTAPTYQCTAYAMRGIMLVPHYTKRGVFVGPGGAEYRKEELRWMRAKNVRTHLWPREWAQKAKLQEVI